MYKILYTEYETLQQNPIFRIGTIRSNLMEDPKNTAPLVDFLMTGFDSIQWVCDYDISILNYLTPYDFYALCYNYGEKIIAPLIDHIQTPVDVRKIISSVIKGGNYECFEDIPEETRELLAVEHDFYLRVKRAYAERGGINITKQADNYIDAKQMAELTIKGYKGLWYGSDKEQQLWSTLCEYADEDTNGSMDILLKCEFVELKIKFAEQVIFSTQVDRDSDWSFYLDLITFYLHKTNYPINYVVKIMETINRFSEYFDNSIAFPTELIIYAVDKATKSTEYVYNEDLILRTSYLLSNDLQLIQNILNKTNYTLIEHGISDKNDNDYPIVRLVIKHNKLQRKLRKKDEHLAKRRKHK